MSIRSLAVLLVGAPLLSGCVSAESRWQTAQKHDTIAAYEAFLQKVPKAKYAPSARERIEELIYEEVGQTGTVQSLEGYLREYPNGKYALAVRERVKQLRFQQAKSEGRVALFEQFIAMYPSDPMSRQLEEELPRMRQIAREREERLRRTENARRLGELLIAWASKTGRVYIPLRPITNAQEINQQNVARLRTLLAAGADPSAIRIQGFSPAVGFNWETPNMTKQLLINGKPGEVVSSDQEGITLLEYCTANKLEVACELLRANGAK